MLGRDIRARGGFAVLLATLLLSSLSAVAASAGARAAASAAVQEDAPPVSLGAYADPIRFEAPEGVVLDLGELGRFTGTVEARLSRSGALTVVNDLPIDAYVAGLAEMPTSWPIEALKAQAVAGRTYAWFELEQGRWRGRGYDICSSTSCQVFHGHGIVETPGTGERWLQAVTETAGQVLVHEGGPILARYFSTSGGATQNNEVVFPNEGPRPYLKGVDDPDDAVSPLHRWQVRFDRAVFDDLLTHGRSLAAASPIADAEFVAPAGGATARVRVTGADGTVAEVSASDFRGFISGVAPDLYPDLYPSARAEGGRKLPTTLPSSRFTIAVEPDEVVIDGRGWGHGVGMGQYGAKGKAERGLAYDDILASYYTGLRPTPTSALPATIRVGLDDDAGSIAVTANGPFRVVVAGIEVTDRGLGTWRVHDAADRTLRLEAPTGYGAPLVVSPTDANRTDPSAIEIVRLETVVNKASELVLEISDSAGVVALTRPLGIVEAGRHTTTWSLDDGGGTPLVPGTYRAVIRAQDETDTVDGTPADIEIRDVIAGPSLAASSWREPAEEVRLPVAPGLVVLAGLVLGALVGTVLPPGRGRPVA